MYSLLVILSEQNKPVVIILLKIFMNELTKIYTYKQNKPVVIILLKIFMNELTKIYT